MQYNVIAAAAARSLQYLREAVADFMVEEFVFRPAPNANHALWQLGHLAVSEDEMVSELLATPERMTSEIFQVAFQRDRARENDVHAFPTPQQALTVLGDVRARSCRWIESLASGGGSDPGPLRMRGYLPTADDVVLAIPEHAAMHLGQIQVIRRCLGKSMLM
jgi:DinB superfamily